MRQATGRGGRRGSTSSPRRRRAIRQLAVEKTAIQGRVTQATVCKNKSPTKKSIQLEESRVEVINAQFELKRHSNIERNVDETD